MKQIFSILLTAGALLASAIANAQGYQATVVDAKTGEPVPFATVQTGEHSGTITNDEGVFALSESQVAKLQDSIYISSMGYEKMGLWIDANAPAQIQLPQKTNELRQVLITAEDLDADEILERIKANMADNYKAPLSRYKFFFRQSDYTNMEQLQFTVKKSSIPELNQELMNQITRAAAQNEWYYRETLGDFYGNYNGFKVSVDKAAELYDKNKDVSLDGLSDKLERIFQENVKRDSYLKIKSGIFGTKVQLDSAKNAESAEPDPIVTVETENTQRPDHTAQVTARLDELYTQLFFNEDTELDFLEKSNRYKWALDGYTFINGEPVWILHFTPKGKKDFEGTLYVNTDDYAIMRLDFTNVRPTNSFGLLGIKWRRNVLRGKMLFTADENGHYRPQYLELEDGEYTSVDRPLKVIEKNKNVKGRRKQNELSMDMLVAVNSLTKYEFVVFDAESIDEGVYASARPSSGIQPTYLSAYDPEFWSGYNILEPNQAIQSFKVLEE
ncbi:carboxypeptidase-like regulatory domain-containing protein [Gilvibacter sediminis]|uniref:carboxypeptidase-like regulatory domain-containing protein n=1 Tax=Gilvibacter sediminis TaxID=379071 RepID=UPI00234FF821|nr:carboxypeptidase-like regulatory domain-containing protein [Gilvibacter sediminis]MDC7997021.1 carboxypeptidase-like regulatory domain-containing protein [Gilvibacter sediminis]